MCAVPWLGQGKDGQCALRIENCGTANGNVCRHEAGSKARLSFDNSGYCNRRAADNIKALVDGAVGPYSSQ